MLLQQAKGLIKISVVLTVLTVAAFGAPQSNEKAAEWANQAANNGKLGQPNFHVEGVGGRQNSKNWAVNGGNIGVGVKAWKSRNGRHSVGVGANYEQSFGRSQGHSWKGRPDRGFGASYNYKFG